MLKALVEEILREIPAELLEGDQAKLVDWLTEHPDKQQEIAEKISEFVADNSEQIINALSEQDWGRLANWLVALAEMDDESTH